MMKKKEDHHGRKALSLIYVRSSQKEIFMISNMPAIPCLGEDREAITWSDAGWIEPWLIQLGPNFSQRPDAIISTMKDRITNPYSPC